MNNMKGLRFAIERANVDRIEENYTEIPDRYWETLCYGDNLEGVVTDFIEDLNEGNKHKYNAGTDVLRFTTDDKSPDLRAMEQSIEQQILSTPTGRKREMLTDINIHIKLLIEWEKMNEQKS